MMPGKDGYEICQEIRQDPELWDTYVILLTARGQQADRERGLLAGADEYVIKPFSVRALIKLMQEFLSRSRSRRCPDHVDRTSDWLVERRDVRCSPR